MNTKMKIKVPFNDLNVGKKELNLKKLNEMYDKFEFVESCDDLIHFDVADNNENIFAIIINVKGISKPKARLNVYNIIQNYKVYTDCEFIFLPSITEENQVIKLSNTDKVVELLH